MAKLEKNTAQKSALTMDKLVALCKGRGFVFAGSEIYGGLANTWDYGPLGVELSNNIKSAWWKKFILEQPANVGVDCGIIQNNTVWEASGHLGGFSDPLIDCKSCKVRHRADSLIENYAAKKKVDIKISTMTDADMNKFLKDKAIPCPNCGKSEFTDIRQFNLMFKTFLGPSEASASVVHLRPETAQGIFVNFMNIQRSMRCKVPFGIGQIGKAFRNEITPGNFIYRTVEFEQMELEFFCEPTASLKYFEYYKKYCHEFLLSLGMKKENLKLRDHDKDELSHYSQATTDFEFNFPFGWGELWGIAHRGDYDLTVHAKKSGKTIEYTDPVSGAKYIPHVVEPSLGVGRALLAFLCNAYEEEVVSEGDSRVVLKLHPFLAPYKAAIFPLQKKELGAKADEVFKKLYKHFNCAYDDSGSLGKRYRRHDEIGTPFCVTVDFDALNDNAVTIRDRDTMKQVRIDIDKLVDYIKPKLEF
ncbi:MAG: glycine--tRNA ligase [Firmicutes bacterium]|nr:glycine--tRNA ligase [Bacillota bacterium]